jgi:hypothetical protein
LQTFFQISKKSKQKRTAHLVNIQQLIVAKYHRCINDEIVTYEVTQTVGTSRTAHAVSKSAICNPVRFGSINI